MFITPHPDKRQNKLEENIMKVIAIVGSPRAHGNTSYLVDEALKEVSRSGLDRTFAPKLRSTL